MKASWAGCIKSISSGFATPQDAQLFLVPGLRFLQFGQIHSSSVKPSDFLSYPFGLVQIWRGSIKKRRRHDTWIPPLLYTVWIGVPVEVARGIFGLEVYLFFRKCLTLRIWPVFRHIPRPRERSGSHGKHPLPHPRWLALRKQPRYRA